jgi:hypothetical protein
VSVAALKEVDQAFGRSRVRLGEQVEVALSEKVRVEV